MEKQRLLKLIENCSERDAIGMILSNYIDCSISDMAAISYKQFDEVVDCMVEWADKKPA